MTEHARLKKDINRRFNHLTVCLREAQKAMGLQVESVAYEESIQSDAGRKLLRVEKQAIRDKELNERSHTNFVNSVREMIHAEIITRLEAHLEKPELLYDDWLNMDPLLPELLDLLSVRASSIVKIERAAASLPWLYDELIKLINTPKYRKVDAKGKVVVVESLKVALSFLGIENLKMLIPAIALRRSLPQITDPFPEIKRRINDAAIGTAMSCKKLAQVCNVDEYTSFVLGLLHDVGKIVVIRLYFKLFEEVQREALIEAQNERKRDEHLALGEISPSDQFIMQLIDKYAYPLSAQFLELMRFKRLFVAIPMQEFAENKAVVHMSPLAKVLAQGIAYNRYRTLKQHRMMTNEEAKEFLRQFHYPKGALAVLRTTDLRDFDLDLD